MSIFACMLFLEFTMISMGIDLFWTKVVEGGKLGRASAEIT